MHASTPAALKDPENAAMDVRSRVGSVVSGRYRILRMIGEGGMGAVFEAEVLGTGERVAVKLIKPEYSASQEVNARFLHEVRAAASVGHANIVRMLDAGTDSYGPYMVLELLVGETLCDTLERRPLRAREGLGVMAAVLDALQAAHAANIVHRDIKPENIFLVGGADQCSAVKLLDFGISKMLTLQSSMGGLTRVGTAVGTPDYMSPEQAGGSRVDGRADLWSVGAVLYEALSLEHPFEGDNYQQLISHIVLHPHRPLQDRVPDAPPALCAFIDRALRKSPAERFASAAEMLAEARRISATLPPDAPLALRVDDPTAAIRTAPNEPTQVIEVRASVAAERAAPSRRPPPAPVHDVNVDGPTNVSLPSVARFDASGPGNSVAIAAPTSWPQPMQGPGPAKPPPTEERGISRGTVHIVAAIAAALVLIALALRIRAALEAPPAPEEVTPTTTTIAPQPAPAPAPAPEPPRPPAPQVAQAINPPAAVAQPIASPPAVAQTPRAVVRAPAPSSAPSPGTAAPRRLAAPSRSTPASVTVGRAVYPILQACAVGPPRYVGAVQLTLRFGPLGQTEELRLQRPSRMTVHGRCLHERLLNLRIPAARGSTVPVFTSVH